MRSRSRGRESSPCPATTPETSGSGMQGRSILRKDSSCCCLRPQEKRSETKTCDNTDFYTQLLGPTADETLLNGLALLQAMVKQFNKCSKDRAGTKSTTRMCKCCKCGQKMSSSNQICCQCGTQKKTASLLCCKKSSEKVPSNKCCSITVKESLKCLCAKPSKKSICVKDELCQNSTEKCPKKSKESVCIPPTNICCTVSRENLHGTDCICYECCLSKKKGRKKSKESFCSSAPTTTCYALSKEQLHGSTCACPKCCPMKKKCCSKPKSSNCSASPDCQSRNEPPVQYICQRIDSQKCNPPKKTPTRGLLCMFKGGSKRSTCPAKCATCNCGKHLIYYD